MDETYIKIRGQWKYLYRAVDKEGNTVDFLLRAHRDKAAARHYFEKSIEQNGEPETVTIDKSGANLAALDALNPERETPIKTYGELRVDDVMLEPAVDAVQVLELAARLGGSSAHPVSRALLRYATEAGPVGFERAPFEHARELRGLGVLAETPEGVAVLGRYGLLARYVQALPEPRRQIEGPCVGLVLNGQLLAWFAFADALRAEAKDVLAELRELGLTRQTLLTGDREPVARKLAADTGIAVVVAQVLPHDKLDYVVREMAAGYHPLVVGDGLNDVLAIKAGPTSIAMGERGIDIAVASADVVLLGDDLRRIPMCVRLGRRCLHTAAINAAIGLSWTAAVIALAASGVLGAVWIALLHNLGTFIVIANAGRLLRMDEDIHLPQPMREGNTWGSRAEMSGPFTRAESDVCSLAI